VSDAGAVGVMEPLSGGVLLFGGSSISPTEGLLSGAPWARDADGSSATDNCKLSTEAE
jgi:hypothetical protein